MDESLSVLGQLARLVVAATVVERVLAFVFEHEWFLRLFTRPSPEDEEKRVSKIPGLKGMIALAMSLWISFRYEFDILRILFGPSAPASTVEAATVAGMTFTGFVIAGGSAGAIAVFQAYLDFDKKTRDALMEARKAEADSRKQIAKANAKTAEHQAEEAGFRKESAAP